MCDLEKITKITDTSNKRMFDRNIPSQVLQPYLSVRPVMTKYSILPIVDPRKTNSVPLIQQPTYNQNTMFNPGNNTAPWSGYASNVNLESELRNQVYALQKCDQAVYVPSSQSDLYKFSFQSNKPMNQPFPDLFKQEIYSDFNPNCEQVGKGTFYNHTRQQLKSDF